MRACLLTLILCLGCNSPTDTGDEPPQADPPVPTSPEPPDDTEPPSDAVDEPCVNEIVSAFPVAGGSEVSYRTHVEFTLSETTGDEDITVSAGGAIASGSTSVVDNRVLWHPDAPLLPSTTYDVALEWECGTEVVTWTTGPLGTPVDPSALQGETYALDLATGRFVTPGGLGSLLQQHVLDQEVLLGVTHADDALIEVLGASATPSGQQDLCTPTFPFDTADFSQNPYLSVTAAALPANFEGMLFHVYDLAIHATFAPDASSLEAVTLAGTIDARELGPLLDMSGDETCSLLVAFGATCVTCSDGGDYCTPLQVEWDSVPRLPWLPLVPRSVADISADVTCH